MRQRIDKILVLEWEKGQNKLFSKECVEFKVERDSMRLENIERVTSKKYGMHLIFFFRVVEH